MVSGWRGDTIHGIRSMTSLVFWYKEIRPKHQALRDLSLAHNTAEYRPAVAFFSHMVRSGDVENWMGREAFATLRQTTRGNELLRML